MPDLKDRIASLSPEKRAILEQELAKKKAEAAVRRSIPRRREDAPALLSFAQQRLWFIDQMQPGSALYNVPRAMRLSGRLDMAALQRALEEIVRRHEVLRSTFVLKESDPVQIVAADTTFPLPTTDLSGFSEAGRQAEVKRLSREEATRPFDLAHDRMIRGQLLVLGEEEHILLLTLHHIASDGWSNDILIRELNRLYDAFRAGRPSPLPDLPIQYADYAAWQRDWVQGEVSEAQLTYWRTQLSGAAFGLPIRTDRSEPAATCEGGTHQFSCPKAIADSLEGLARSEKATLYMVLLAAFNGLLYQDMRQEDICIGTPVSGRRWTETEGLIGLFLNTLLIRTDLSGNPSFRALVRRVRQTVLEAYSNQDLPFEQVVDALRPQREMSHTPLFRLWFVVDDVRSRVSASNKLSIQSLPAGVGMAKYAIRMGFSQIPDGLVGSVLYQKDLFDAATIQRLMQKMEALLTAVAVDPDLPLGEIVEQLTEIDRRSREEHEQRLDEENRSRFGRITRTAIRR